MKQDWSHLLVLQPLLRKILYPPLDCKDVLIFTARSRLTHKYKLVVLFSGHIALLLCLVSIFFFLQHLFLCLLSQGIFQIRWRLLIFFAIHRKKKSLRFFLQVLLRLFLPVHNTKSIMLSFPWHTVVNSFCLRTESQPWREHYLSCSWFMELSFSFTNQKVRGILTSFKHTHFSD